MRKVRSISRLISEHAIPAVCMIASQPGGGDDPFIGPPSDLAVVDCL